MRCYVLNLDRAPDRLAHMQEQFERLMLPFERVAAIDCKLIPASEIYSFRKSLEPAFRRHRWSDVQIAIFLSHKKAWEAIAAQSDGFGAIFEDDVHLSNRISPLLTSEAWLKDVDIARFETTCQSMSLHTEAVDVMGQTKMYRVINGAWGAAGYVISREVAKWLISTPLRLIEPVDWFLFHPRSAVRSLHVYQIDPAPCVQDQYHPDRSARKGFAFHGWTPSGIAPTIRRMISPIVRGITQRRSVRFE